MNESKTDEIIFEPSLVVSERKLYFDLLKNNKENVKHEIKERVLKLNAEFNKSLTENLIQTANWEEIIDTMGYTILRNELFQETKDFKTYHAKKTKGPMQPCLCKIFIQKDLKKNSHIKSIQRLVKVLMNLKSDNIVKLLGAIEVRQTDKLYFFEELTKISLSQFFKKNQTPLSIMKAKTWLSELSSAILYLHNIGFSHQNISLECIYLKLEENGIKLGCPISLAEQVIYDNVKTVSSFKEVFKPIKKNFFSSFDQLFSDSKTFDAMSADIWALGVALFYFLTLKHPFSNIKSRKNMITEVQCKRWSFIGLMDNNPSLDEETKLFLSKIFVMNSENRYTIHELILDPYLFKCLPQPEIKPEIKAESPPKIKTELELENEFVHQERLNTNDIRSSLNEYYKKYKFQSFINFRKKVDLIQLFNFYEKVNYEESIQKDVQINRSEVIYENNNCKIYDAKLKGDKCLVKIETLTSYQKRFQIKDLNLSLKLMLTIKENNKFIQLLKIYSIGPKIYFFFDVFKDLTRLKSILQQPNGISFSQAKIWIKQFAEAIYFLHSKGLTHRNLDPNYIFIKNENIIIGQIEGLTPIFENNENKNEIIFSQKNLNKTHYSSPESIFTDKDYDPLPSDIWSIAAIIYHCIFLKVPFVFKAKKDYLEQIDLKRWLHVIDPKYKLENEFFEFFDSIFVKCPESRPVAVELLFMNITK